MCFIDGTVNPHLALVTIIRAGLMGLKSGKKLEVKDCVGPKCASQMDDAERKAFEITKRMPLNIEQVRDDLEKDEVIKEIFGSVLVEKYLAGSKGEVEEQELTCLV
ncbi:hypothetical protein MPER_06988 [Moniliophthora perniciosa FA553]|nr:hypothetical protein MPER_06988 [Moniliophthora perniciosa FA553]